MFIEELGLSLAKLSTSLEWLSKSKTSCVSCQEYEIINKEVFFETAWINDGMILCSNFTLEPRKVSKAERESTPLIVDT